MKLRNVLERSSLAFLLVLVATGLVGEFPGALAGEADPSAYVKKDTWVETMLASRAEYLRRQANQLSTYNAIGLVSPELPSPADQLASYPDPFDEQGPLDDRAKAYLHANCAQCHRPAGPTPSLMDLRFQTSLTQMSICNEPVQGNTLEILNPRLIAPGEPERSMILQRMLLRDENGMPPLASNIADSQGADLLSQWIAGLVDCQ